MQDHIATSTFKPTTLPNGADTASEPMRHAEGAVARNIEEQTAKLPSDAFLWAALATIGISMVMQASGKKEGSLFVGQWVAPFLLFGVYNKLVKVAGSDRVTR